MAVAEDTKKALLWDQVGERIYETGDRNVALYVYQDTEETFTDPTSTAEGATTATHQTHFYNGVAWNGITAMTESPSGAEPTDLWADDTKYATLRSAEQFGGTIEAYTYPDAWGQCDGTEAPVTGVFLGQQVGGVDGGGFGEVGIDVLGCVDGTFALDGQQFVAWFPRGASGCNGSLGEEVLEVTDGVVE